jgi:hypothetical protein
VVAQLAQGQQIAHQRLQARKQNSQIADFLTFLMQSENENTIQKMTRMFFFTSSGMRVSDTPLHLIVALFIPFYHEQAVEYDLKKLYEHDFFFDKTVDLHSYLTFVKKTFDEYFTLHQTHHHYGYVFDLDKGDFVSLVIDICLAHGLIQNNQSDLDSVRSDMQHLV